MKIISVILIIITLNSCIHRSKEDNVNEEVLNCKIPYIEITKRCYLDTAIVFVCPKQKVLDSLLKTNGDKWYSIFEEDAEIYNTDAQTFLLSKNKTNNYMVSDSMDYYIFVSKKRPFGINKNDYIKEYNSSWLIILFNGKDDPVVTAPVNIEETYNNYFK